MFLVVTSILDTKHLINTDYIESISETVDGEICIILNSGRVFNIKETILEIQNQI